MRRIAALVLALGVLGVLGACSSGHPMHTDQPSLIPWDASAPALLQPRPGPAARPCRAVQLRVVGKGFRFAPALSGGTGSVTLRNAGPRACRLTGRPEVRLVGAKPAPAQRQQPQPAQAPSFPHVLQPADILLALPPGGRATLRVTWRNWCIPRAAKRPVPPKAMRITLAGRRGHIDADYDSVPPCDSPAEPSTIGVRPFQPAPLPATAPWTTGEATATIEPLEGKSVTARRGETARFAVQLHNRSTAPVHFDRCPLFVELLAPAGSPEVHQLNCAADAIPPGGALRFEMHIHVPATAPMGNNGLFWELDPTGAQAPEVVSRLVVGK